MRFSLFVCSVWCVGCLLAVETQAQINPVRQAMSRMEKGKWESARQLLQKSLRKDSLNIESKYMLSRWFVTPANPAYHIDSSYYYAQAALRDYAVIDSKLKDRLKKFPVDSAILLQNRHQVDSLAFERSKKSNTELSYTYFIDKFQYSIYQKEAIELRDEVCYLEALKANTYQAYKSYIDRYPSSGRIKEAQDRYERLLFEDRTRDRKAISYRYFIKEFPNSPFLSQALKEVFEISTASGERPDFIKFISDFPNTSFSRHALDILFHRLKDSESALPKEMLTDSLREVIHVESKGWIPFLKNGKFGFMDTQGKEHLSERFAKIDERYLCGNVRDEILSTSEGLIARSGKKISPPVSAVEDVGSGFLQVEREGCRQLIHKSGRMVVAECFADAEILFRRFIKIKREQSVSLYALNGRKLTQGWRDIVEKEGVLLFDNHAKWLVASKEQVAALADGNALPTTLVFDQVTVADQHQLLVRNGALEGVLNPQLQFVVPLERQTLQTSAVGILRKQNDLYRLGTVAKELEPLRVKKIDFEDRWMVLQEENNNIQLFDLNRKKIVASKADSVWFDRKMALVQDADSLTIFFQSGLQTSVKKGSKINFITSRDTVNFFYTESRGKKTVMNIQSGARLFTTDFDGIESLSTSVFQITRKNKKFLMGSDGKLLTALDFDLIVKTNPFQLALLKNKKFGLYDLRTRTLVKPEYERNLEALPSNYYVAYKEGVAGIIDRQSKVIIDFDFDEIKPWTDSVVWAKRGAQWMLYDIATQRVVMDKIRSYQIVSSDSKEKIALIQKDLFYGILSSSRGVVIPPTFNDVINLGSEEEALYFTEKRVEEADIYVVIYFDRLGKMVRKQVLEPEEYDRIYCEEGN